MSTPALGAYIALYCREVLGDVHLAALSDEQFGRWVKYLCVMSEIGGRLPGDPSEIARRSRVDVRKVRHDLLWFPTFFVQDETDGSWRSVRLEKQVAKYAKKVEIARENGQSETPEMGEIPAPDIDPYMGVSTRPEMGVVGHPEMGDIARGTQSQTQSLREGTKTTNPPTPLGRGAVAEEAVVAPKKPRRQRFQDSLLEIPEVEDRHIQASGRIREFWRKKDPCDGRIVGIDERLLVMRLQQIEKRQPLYTMAVLEEAGRAFCAKERPRYNAPEYFYSFKPLANSGQPPFKEFADAIVNRERRMPMAVPPPPPHQPSLGH